MDVEDELRRAMAETVAGARAPRSLAADVRRRHRRRKARIRTAAAVAGASVAALALAPAYRSIQPAPAGAPEGVVPSAAASGDGAPERVPAPVPSRPPESGKGGTAEPRTPRPSTGAPDAPAAEAPRAEPSLPAWLAYLPDGLDAARPCATERGTARTTTVCEWRGDPGWVRIRLVEGTGIGGPEELAPPVGVPVRTSVRGTPALAGAAPGSGRQVSWLPRAGLGATVQAGGAAAGDLMRIAEGVRP
ncbi:hypothetical protein [Actinomadura sp. WAC 06369]|uniref:hypothetical protein n=1 Tax=Actinomadura sp. WAC 06369 TaxID=2203193 RepID=UPI000F78CB77|nr:hypothetical protein [Actinomadura sp. WAC 06369]RSN71084.1 hypothetical protein DMH08_03740 [Actinomadura sp. WAC 06369]